VKESIESAASKLGFDWQVFRPSAASDYDEIFARISAEHFDAAYIQADQLSSQPNNRQRIVQLTLRHLMPAVGEGKGLANEGLLLTYNQDFDRTAVRGAEYVDKILRGMKPSELPIEQATELQLVINLQTAKALGITVPPTMLARANEVIE
jgi:putative tryptophan/tyrosine transport system substrate-binding protein